MNVAKPLVSIIVPIFNVEDYLRECLDSICKQSYQNLEIILVDDGSTDSCNSICDDYSIIDKRINVIHKKNGGLSDARNTGMLYATGKYIYFCDSDDFLRDDAIEYLVDAAEGSNADIVLFDSYVIKGRDFDSKNKSYTRSIKYPSGKGESVAFLMLVNDEYIPCVQLCFYKSEYILTNHLSFYKGIVGEDELFSFYSLIRESHVIHINESLYYHRLRPGSIMTTRYEKMVGRFNDYCTIAYEMYDYANYNKKLSNKLFKELIGRISKSAILIFREMNKVNKTICSNEYCELKRFIRNNKGFGDVSLLIRLRYYKSGIIVSGIRKYFRKFIYRLSWPIKYC